MKGKIGYINKQGETVIAPQFSQGLDISEGFASVEFIRGKSDGTTPQVFGYIDKTGRKAIKADFASAESFSESLAAVNMKSRRKISYIDPHGEVIIADVACQMAGQFKNEVASIAQSGNELGYINRKGDFVWEPQA